MSPPWCHLLASTFSGGFKGKSSVIIIDDIFDDDDDIDDEDDDDDDDNDDEDDDKDDDDDIDADDAASTVPASLSALRTPLLVSNSMTSFSFPVLKTTAAAASVA